MIRLLSEGLSMLHTLKVYTADTSHYSSVLFINLISVVRINDTLRCFVTMIMSYCCHSHNIWHGG